ncbi:MAG: hypothetical protein U0T77_04685 [Chitinophagales bacterium]
MSLLDQIFKKTTLDKIKKGFDFLVTDFGFKLLSAKQDHNLRADYYLIYRNDSSEIQLEICADESWFHCEIRRLINGNPADYDDKTNCLSFEDLAIWESENNYDHFDYYVCEQNGLEGVIENTAKLFKRNQRLLTTNIWLDTNKIQDLKDKDFENKFGKLPDRNKPTFFRSLKKEINKLLADTGYTVHLNSDKVSPFDPNSMTNRLILQNKKTKIEISQKDWRDDYYIYEVYKNDNKVFEIDVSKIEIKRAVELTINKLEANV